MKWLTKSASATRFAAALACAALLGCPSGDNDGEEQADVGEEARTEAPVPVEVAAIEPADMRRVVVGNTTLEARRQVTVVSEIAGRVEGIEVDEGDVVAQGAHLADLSNDESGIAIREAQQALARHERQLEAYRPLYESGYLARQVFEETEFLRDNARLALERARQVQSDQRVRAPISGAVVSRHIEVGDVAVPNQPLFDLASTEELDAVISVPERELSTLREGQQAELTVEALDGAVVHGTVTRIHPIVDPQTGTVQIRIAVDGGAAPADSPSLRPGMFTTVRVVTDVREQVPAVPRRALMYDAEVPWVFVLRDRVEAPDDGSGVSSEASDASETPDAPAGDVYEVERVRLELGYDDVERAEVLSGLLVGDRVVTAGQSGLDADARVRVVDDASEP